MGYPIILELSNRPVLVVGAGRVATRRVERLVEEGAKVTVVAPEATARIRELAEAGRLEFDGRPYRAGDVHGFELVFAATDDPLTNARVAREAEDDVHLLNIADTSAPGDFAVPARIRRGPLQVCIDTGGGSPALTRELRERLDEIVGPEWGEAADSMARLRPLVGDSAAGETERRAFWREVAAGFVDVLQEERDVAAWLAQVAKKHGVNVSEDAFRRVIARG